MKIAFIGAGNMGGAIVKGLYLSKVCKADELFVADASEEALKNISRINKNIFITTNNGEAAKRADYIIIAVKPWLVDTVIDSIQSSIKSNQIIISIAAGIELSHISEKIGKNYTLFRVLPNTAVSLLDGMNFIPQRKQRTRRDHTQSIQ